MSSVASSRTASPPPRRGESARAIVESLRELSVQMTMLNLKVGERVGIKDVDLKCLDLLTRHGPHSPSALAKLAGLHPATMTGVLDRLEKAGWIVRERDPDDRRSVLVKAVEERAADIVREYSPMVELMQELFGRYENEQLETIADFMHRLVEAGREAAATIGER
jgi:DNA-binding MarR family transcriptional regulator